MLSTIWGSGSSWFWSMMQFFAVSISLLFIYRQLKIQRQANVLQAIHKMDDRWDSDDMIKSRDQVCKNKDGPKERITYDENKVLIFFEDLGIYRKRNIFDKKIIWDTYSIYIEYYWPMLLPKIQEEWASGDESVYLNFKELYRETLKLAKKNSKSKGIKTQEEVRAFCDAERKRFEHRGLKQSKASS